MYGLSENGCLSVQNFKDQYFIMDFMLPEAEIQRMASTGQEYPTSDGKIWRVTKDPTGSLQYPEYMFCPVGSGTSVCISSAEFMRRYPDGIVNRTQEYYKTEMGDGPLYLTSDGVVWVSVPDGYGNYRACQVNDPALIAVLTGGGSGPQTEFEAGCLSQQQFLSTYGSNLLSVKGEPFASTGNNDYFFTPDGKLWVSITVAGQVGAGGTTYKYCEVKDEAEKAEIFNIYGYQNSTNVNTVTSDDIDCCGYCNETEQITEETWYLTQICTKEPCYPMNIDITKIRCITPDDGMNYELDCDDVETAVNLINQQRGVQGMSGLRDCNCNSMMGLGNATDVVSSQNLYQPAGVQPANNDYVLNKVCVPANNNWGIWLLAGSIAGFVLPKVFGKGK